MFRKKNKEQAIPKGVVGTNIEDIRLTKKEREEIEKAERARIQKQMAEQKGRYQIIKSTQRVIPVDDIYNGVISIRHLKLHRAIFSSKLLHARLMLKAQLQPSSLITKKKKTRKENAC